MGDELLTDVPWDLIAAGQHTDELRAAHIRKAQKKITAIAAQNDESIQTTTQALARAGLAARELGTQISNNMRRLAQTMTSEGTRNV